MNVLSAHMEKQAKTPNQQNKLSNRANRSKQGQFDSTFYKNLIRTSKLL